MSRKEANDPAAGDSALLNPESAVIAIIAANNMQAALVKTPMLLYFLSNQFTNTAK
jgi:hypothetical protein